MQVKIPNNDLTMKIIKVVPEDDVIKQTDFLYSITSGKLQEIMKGLSDKVITREQMEIPAFSNQTPLVTAIGNKQTDIARVFLVFGANPNTRQGINGPTALMLASSLDDHKLVNLLLDKGADINAVVEDPNNHYAGHTALFFAAANSASMTVEILMRRGIDSYITNDKGDDVIKYMQQVLITGSSSLKPELRNKQHRAYGEMSLVIEGIRNEKKKTEL